MLRYLFVIPATAASYLMVHGSLVICLLWLVAFILAMSTNSAKAKTTEPRVNNLVSAIGTTNSNVTTQTGRVNNLSGQSTSTGQPPGLATSGPHSNFTSTSSSYPTGQTSAQQGSGTSHYHDYGGHYHDMGSHTHDFEGHTHNLPVV